MGTCRMSAGSGEDRRSLERIQEVTSAGGATNVTAAVSSTFGREQQEHAWQLGAHSPPEASAGQSSSQAGSPQSAASPLTSNVSSASSTTMTARRTDTSIPQDRAARAPPGLNRGGFLQHQASLRGVAQLAVAVDELLFGAPRRLVNFRRAANHLKFPAELGVQLVWAIPRDVEPTAAGGPFGTERPDKNVATGFQGSPDGRDVATPIRLVAQEVKNGAIVPEGVRVSGEIDLRDVRDEPSHGGRTISEACLRRRDGFG